MLEFANLFYKIVMWLFLLYGTAVFLVYAWIAMYALGAVIRYKKKNTFTDYNIIAGNHNAPYFSVIAPAYNEGKTIVENIRSLLSLYYNNLEIIIVNDGSKDDSLQKMIDAYELEQISFYIQGQIETSKVRGVYKSKNPAFKKLIIVDKENGGKADALNVGVNISCGKYILCIDVDCILEQDSILKLAKPFLEQTDKRLIACGGVIRLTNNCKIENGKVTEVNMPKSILGRTQALEYIRAFVLGRMAWSRASGLILISGAFGAFDREIVMACGGYDRHTVGEDMELVVRMRKYMEEKKEKYSVITIPDALCWTQVPESREVLRKQRNRWMRGTMETLWKHRGLMFNPKYRKLGMLSLPYWFMFEFLGPLIEFTGYIVFLLFLVFGIINWPFFFVLFALVISTGFLFSIYAILIDLVSHQVYAKRQDFLTLIGTAVIEPFYFHPIVLKAGVDGFFDYFKKTVHWGEMKRQSFNEEAEKLPLKDKLLKTLAIGFQKTGVFAVVILAVFLLGILAEWGWYRYNFIDLKSAPLAEFLLINNLLFVLKYIFGISIIYLILNFINEKWGRILVIISSTFVAVTQFLLFLYFSESHNMLGADLMYYSAAEMKQILQASGMLSLKNLALVVFLVAIIVTPFWLAAKFTFNKTYVGISFLALGLVSFIIPSDFLNVNNSSFSNEFAQNAAKSKWNYFFASNVDNYLSEHPKIANLWESNEEISTDKNGLNASFPFWREDKTPDFLGQYFNQTEQAPNLVFVLIEGMGHAYSSPNGYIGNFTPFLDELAHKSLYWENGLSSAGRTFGVIPSITGSLPFGKNGFLEIEKTPDHFNLFNVLKANGFETGFFYGGEGTFDRTKTFLQYSDVDNIIDINSYRKPARKLPAENGNSWGYEDQAVFSKMLQVQNPAPKPYFDVLLTLSTHNPFLINDADKYEKMYNTRINSGVLNADQKKIAVAHKKQLISVLNADDALKNFFADYEKRSDFKNTIFVITGDHSMPEITLESKIDRYHVPIMVYSPLLKQPKKFFNVVSHFDIAPSILSYYKNNYALRTPSTSTWIGNGLSDKMMSNQPAVPLMQSKYQLIDYVYGKYHLNDNQLFTYNNLVEGKIADAEQLKKVQKSFNQFKKKNSQFFTTQKLMPDSVVVNFMQKVKPKF